VLGLASFALIAILATLSPALRALRNRSVITLRATRRSGDETSVTSFAELSSFPTNHIAMNSGGRHGEVS